MVVNKTIDGVLCEYSILDRLFNARPGGLMTTSGCRGFGSGDYGGSVVAVGESIWGVFIHGTLGVYLKQEAEEKNISFDPFQEKKASGVGQKHMLESKSRVNRG